MLSEAKPIVEVESETLVAVPPESLNLRAKFEVTALDVLHRKPEDSFGLAGGIHLHEVWMIESGRGLGLLSEPCNVLDIPGHIGLQRLDRNETVERGLSSLINRPHAALAEDLKDFEFAKLLTFKIHIPKRQTNSKAARLPSARL